MVKPLGETTASKPNFYYIIIYDVDFVIENKDNDDIKIGYRVTSMVVKL